MLRAFLGVVFCIHSNHRSFGKSAFSPGFWRFSRRIPGKTGGGTRRALATDLRRYQGVRQHLVDFFEAGAEEKTKQKKTIGRAGASRFQWPN